MKKTDTLLQKELNAISRKYGQLDELTSEQKIARIDELFNAYEECDTPAATYWSIIRSTPTLDGLPFKIVSRVSLSEASDIDCLPMWVIQFESGAHVVAYPEEIYEETMLNEGRDVGTVFNEQIYKKGYKLARAFRGESEHSGRRFILSYKKDVPREECWMIVFDDGTTYDARADEIFEKRRED